MKSSHPRQDGEFVAFQSSPHPRDPQILDQHLQHLDEADHYYHYHTLPPPPHHHRQTHQHCDDINNLDLTPMTSTVLLNPLSITSTCVLPALCHWIHHQQQNSHIDPCHKLPEEVDPSFRSQVIVRLFDLLAAAGSDHHHHFHKSDTRRRLSFQQVRCLARELLAVGDCCLATSEIDHHLAMQMMAVAQSDLSRGMSLFEFDRLMNHSFWDDWLRQVLAWNPKPTNKNRSQKHHQGTQKEEVTSKWSFSMRSLVLPSSWPTLYLVLMIAGFVYKYYHSGHRSQVPWESITGKAMAVAQAFTQVLYLHAFLMVLSVSRSVAALLRKTRPGTLLGAVFPWTNLHRFLATMLLVFGVCHGIAQWIVFVRVSDFCRDNCDQFFQIFQHDEFGAVQQMATVDSTCHCVLPRADLFASFPAITGYILIVVLVLMLLIWNHALAHNRYHVFEQSHKWLALVFTVLFCIHGLQKWIQPLKAFHYIVFPVVIIVVERRNRFVCFSNPTIRMKQWYATRKPLACQPQHHHESETRSNVHDDDLILTLVFDIPSTMKNPTHWSPASVAYLNFPQISRAEWHPYTIFCDQSHTNQEIWFYVRIVGDWTHKLHDLLLQETSVGTNTTKQVNLDIDIGLAPIKTLACTGLTASSSLKCCFDGPIATTTSQCVHYASLAFIATGCGIVPFLSVLNHVVSGWKSSNWNDDGAINHNRWPKIRRIQVVWVVRHFFELDAFTPAIQKCLEPLLLSSRNEHEVPVAPSSPIELDLSVFLTCSSATRTTSTRSQITPPMVHFRRDLLHRLQTHLATTTSCLSLDNILPLALTCFHCLRLPFINSSVHFGRPDWKTQLMLFKTHHEAYNNNNNNNTADSRLGVFVCGNDSIHEEIQTLCRSSQLQLDCLVEAF